MNVHRANPSPTTRTRILDAAETLFAEQGFDATATTAIATAAHVPKGLIFYYFPSKESVLDALIAERLPTEPISDVLALVAPGDPATSLVNLDTALNLGHNDSSVLRVIVWREAETHTDVRSHLRTFRAYLHDTTMRVLQASTPAPVSVNAVRTAATTWVSAMLSAATTDRLFGRDGLPRAHEELQNVARLIAAGMSGMTPLPRMLARSVPTTALGPTTALH